MQGQPVKKMSSLKRLDSPNFWAFSPILFNLFNNALIFEGQSRELYGLLPTPQCDKPWHLLGGRRHTLVILCFQQVFYSTINCAKAVLSQKKIPKNYFEYFSGAFFCG